MYNLGTGAPAWHGLDWLRAYVQSCLQHVTLGNTVEHNKGCSVTIGLCLGCRIYQLVSINSCFFGGASGISMIGAGSGARICLHRQLTPTDSHNESILDSLVHKPMVV